MTKTAIIGFHDPANQEVYSMIAKEKGYDVHSASNIEELKERLQERQNYDMILMDPNLGDWNGCNITALLEVLKTLNGRIESGKTKLMTITGREELANKVKEIAPCKLKPFVGQELFDWLAD
jgi:CheY-like chemotaxis protein